MIYLTENDKEVIRHSDCHQKVSLSLGSFYIKLVGPERGLKELLGSSIAMQMGLVTPNNEVIMIDNEYFLLGEDLNKYGKFINAEEMDIDDSVLDHCAFSTAAQALATKYSIGDEISNLIKVYFYDILFHHFDRNKRNWGLLFLPDGTKKITILDNEYLLVEPNHNEKLKLYMSEDIPTSLEEDFKYYLKAAPQSEIDLFLYYFNIFTPLYIRNTINYLVKSHEITILESDIEDMISAYQNNYITITRIIKSCTEKRGI